MTTLIIRKRPHARKHTIRWHDKVEIAASNILNVEIAPNIKVKIKMDTVSQVLTKNLNK